MKNKISKLVFETLEIHNKKYNPINIDINRFVELFIEGDFTSMTKIINMNAHCVNEHMKPRFLFITYIIKNFSENNINCNQLEKALIWANEIQFGTIEPKNNNKNFNPIKEINFNRASYSLIKVLTGNY